MNDKFILKQLTIAQNEVNKRLLLKNDTGIDLANYENGFLAIFENLIIKYFKNKVKDTDIIIDELNLWLWEQNYEIWFKHKPDWIKSKFFELKSDDLNKTPKGYKVNLKKPKNFLKYLYTC